jgi:hypothetical protein
MSHPLPAALRAPTAVRDSMVNGAIEFCAVSTGYIGGETHAVETKRLSGLATVATGPRTKRVPD